MENDILQLSNKDETEFVKSTGKVELFSRAQKNSLYYELLYWRLGQAKKLQISPEKVIQREIIIEIVNTLPTNIAKMIFVANIDSNSIQKYGDEIVSIVKKYLNTLEVKKILYGKESIKKANNNKKILCELGLLQYFTLSTHTRSKKTPLKPKHIPIPKPKPPRPKPKPIAIPQPTPRLRIGAIKVGDTVKIEIDGEIKIHKIIPKITIEIPTWKPGTRRRIDSSKKTISSPDIKKGEISEDSNLANALIGKQVGDYFCFTVDGFTTRGKIIGKW